MFSHIRTCSASGAFVSAVSQCKVHSAALRTIINDINLMIGSVFIALLLHTLISKCHRATCERCRSTFMIGIVSYIHTTYLYDDAGF